METFTELKDFVNDPHYHKKRQESLTRLNISTIDAPIVEIIDGFSRLPYCFTLQSCYGHFLHKNQKNPENTEPLPISDSIARVKYRIAYIALCIQNSDLGRILFHHLRRIPVIDPECIQFGCAEWFWKRQVNSYVLQIEPKRYIRRDVVFISYQEALHIEMIRNGFFNGLKEMTREEGPCHRA